MTSLALKLCSSEQTFHSGTMILWKTYLDLSPVYRIFDFTSGIYPESVPTLCGSDLDIHFWDKRKGAEASARFQTKFLAETPTPALTPDRCLTTRPQTGRRPVWSRELSQKGKFRLDVSRSPGLICTNPRFLIRLTSQKNSFFGKLLL